VAAQNDTSFFGPVAGRVAQRIARGRFVLDGKVYHLNINDGRNTLQGTHRLPTVPRRELVFC
jgi:aldose 1-epimerase